MDWHPWDFVAVDVAFSVVNLEPSEVRATVHLVSAGIFLLALAFMSIFLFPKLDKAVYQRPHRKVVRNRIYVSCGIVMVVAVLVAFVGIRFDVFGDESTMTFWMELVAVEAFGVSWLVKGGAICGDKPV